MESIDDSVYKEWAPSFPDTSAMVDFLSSSSLSSTRLLFEEKNVLLKENLRSVCCQHPFLDGSYVTRGYSQAERGGGTPSDDMFTSDHPSPLASTHGTRDSTFGGDISSSTAAAQHDASGADNMTLAQFSEARRKTNGRGSSRRHLNSSSSMQHLLSSSTPTSPINSATAMNLGQVAFSRSSFVAESSFLMDRKGNQKQMEILSPNAEGDNEEDSSDDSDFEGAFRSPETQPQNGGGAWSAQDEAESEVGSRTQLCKARSRDGELAEIRFELVVSDPRRHFRSLSTHRLKEQKERDALFCQLNYTSDTCREALTELEKQCGDKVYYEDRLYVDKMKKDYTELLFEVEQERLRLIYNGVHPSLSSDDTNDEREPSSHRPFTAHDQSAALPATSTRRKSYNPSVSGGSAPQMLTVNNNDADRNAHDEAFFLSGLPHLPVHATDYRILKTQEKQRQDGLRVAEEEQEHRRKSSHGANHRMAMQVKLHRQIELDELTQRLQTQQSKEVSRSGTRKSSSAQECSIKQQHELRSATTTAAREKEKSAAASDLALLQHALHHFVHRPKD
ncbi:hypothetical protein FI667_g8069, partial [Globisporangium splendens]